MSHGRIDSKPAATRGQDAYISRDALRESILAAVPSASGQQQTPMDRNEFVKAVVTLIHVSALFSYNVILWLMDGTLNDRQIGFLWMICGRITRCVYTRSQQSLFSINECT